ncbi:MAG: nucleoside hydrolase [Oscillospiraceae bacterium]|jgi:inosine-uridine nucleoside N-ribohydrolase
MEKQKIIMDVDTGSDDAIALCMAMLDEHFDLLGICAVNGNVEVKLTTDNSLRVVECCGKQGQVKVYKGCDLPIASTLMPWTAQSLRPFPTREGTREGKIVVHGDHLPLPAPKIKEEKDCAVVWLINTLLASDGDITLIPVGPLTNVAVAMRADPRIIPKIKRIVYMGGGDQITNSSLAAEFNVWADPEAMEIVLQSGVDITMVPLDATHHACMNLADAAEIRAIDTPPARLVADLIESRIKGYGVNNKDMLEAQKAPIHDALAVCSLVHPECLVDVIDCTVHCDISRGFSYGRTLVDRRQQITHEPHNCHFAQGANEKVFTDWVKGVLRKDKERRGL